MINNVNSANSYQVSNTGLKQDELQKTLSKSKQAVSDNFESNSAVKTVSGGAKDPDVMRKTLLLLPPLVVGNRFIDKLIGGAEEKSLLTKFANIGDKISNVLHLDKIVSDETGSRISNFMKNNKFFKYFSNDFKAIPKSSMAKSQTMTEKYTQEIISALKDFKENANFASLLDDGADALSKATKDTITKLADSATASSVNSKQLLSAVDDIIGKGVDTVKQGSLTADPVKLSTLKNKLKASSSQLGKTGLGKGLAKGTLKAKDVLTYGGGLLSLAFMANTLIQAGKAAKEAPKGEKKSTFMHVLSESYLGLVLFQPSISLLYKAGGNKYRGMTEAGRTALKDLITKTNADETITKEALKIAKIQRDLLIKGVDKDKVASLAGKGLAEVKTAAKSLSREGAKLKFWEKPLKLMGRILDTGLDKIQKPRFANLPVLGKVKIPTPTLKGFLGGLGRFAIIMFVIQPFIQKPITKLFHKIFGTPTTYLKKQEEASKTSLPDSVQPNIPTTTPAAVNNAQSSETNLIKKWTQAPVSEQNIASQGLTVENSQPLEPKQNDEIAALNLFNKDKQNGRYIPSIDPVQIDDNEAQIQAQVNAILKSTDSVISNAKKYL